MRVKYSSYCSSLARHHEHTRSSITSKHGGRPNNLQREERARMSSVSGHGGQGHAHHSSGRTRTGMLAVVDRENRAVCADEAVLVRARSPTLSKLHLGKRAAQGLKAPSRMRCARINGTCGAVCREGRPTRRSAPILIIYNQLAVRPALANKVRFNFPCASLSKYRAISLRPAAYAFMSRS